MKVIVMGPNGKMGRAIIKILAQQSKLQLVAGVGVKERDYIGTDLGQLAGLGTNIGVVATDDLEKVIQDGDVIIDFSTKAAGLAALGLAVEYQKAFVCGTTGFTPDELALFQKAGEKIPVLYAANTSKLINVMNALLKLTTELVGAQTDIEILEMHDQWKKDAPSGTAKEMGEIIAHKLGKELNELAVYERVGEAPRKPGEIGFHSLRLGDVPSSHTVYFGGFGERLELTHHSYNFEPFARGACDAAAFLANQAPGYYTFQDVLKSSD